MKKIIILMMSFLFIACSNTQFQELSFENKQELVNFTKEIKQRLSYNDIKFIENNISNNMKNRYILSIISNIDFSKVLIFISEPEYTKEGVVSNFAINTYDRTFYYEMYFIYDGKWKISEIKERG